MKFLIEYIVICSLKVFKEKKKLLKVSIHSTSSESKARILYLPAVSLI